MEMRGLRLEREREKALRTDRTVGAVKVMWADGSNNRGPVSEIRWGY